MSRPRSTFPRAVSIPGALALACAAVGYAMAPGVAHAQACCAGASVITPARLELHERALVGVELRGAVVHGSYTPSGEYTGSPAGDTELDLESDLFAAIRLLQRGQLAVLVPWIETLRRTPQDGSHTGGGIGDINASARFDLIASGASRFVPDVAILAGVTVPTGVSPESARQRLNVDATGIGAWQGQVAVALEQVSGSWLFNFTGIAAARTPRSGETLGTQLTLLGAIAYTLPNDVALAFSVSEAIEGSAVKDGAAVPFSAKRLTRATLSGLWPISDTWRLAGGIFVDPPIQGLGSNQPALSGATLTVIRSWT